MPETVICQTASEGQTFRIVKDAPAFPNPVIEKHSGVDAMGAEVWLKVTPTSADLWTAVQALAAYIVKPPTRGQPAVPARPVGAPDQAPVAILD